MEFRKLIKFGKTSYVISIPKRWVQGNKLKKGDVLSLHEKENELVLSPPKTDNIKKNKEISIIIDNKDDALIRREIVAAYINDFNIINLRGKNLKEKAKKIRDILQNLMALEIIEQTSNRILARDFLNMDGVVILNLVKKMDHIAFAMISDLKSVIEKNISPKNIINRDEDVNRLTHLLFRIIKYKLKNDGFAKTNINEIELLNRWQIISDIEEIADYAKILAGPLDKISDNAVKNKLTKLLSEIEGVYTATMKAYYEMDVKKAFELSSERDQLLTKCRKFRQEKPLNADCVLFRLEETIIKIHDIGRLVYRYGWSG